MINELPLANSIEIGSLEFVAGLPGIYNIYPKEQHYLIELTEELGQNSISKVWQLYQTTGLINENGEMWGTKDSMGMSVGPVPHSIIVAMTEITLAKEIGLDDEMAHTLGVVGLVHDAHKRLEIEKKDPEGTQLVANEKLTQLFGVEIAKLATLSGHTAMPAILERFNDIKSLIVFWVDNVVVGNQLTTVKAKCDYLDKMAEPQIDEITGEVKAGRYAYNNDGIAIYGTPYFTFQRYLASIIEARLVQMAQTSGTFKGLRMNQLSEALQQILAERYQ